MAPRRVSDEVIVTGELGAVQRLLNRAGKEVPGLGEKRAVQVANGQRTMRIGLISNGKDARELMGQLGSMAKADRVAVRAEPNCATATPPLRQKGAPGWNLDPWDWNQDPWDWNQDPWDWNQDPWDGDALPAAVVAAGATAAEGEALFWRQGAFRKIGLTDEAGARVAALANQQGEGVLVAIFDALPSKPVSYPWLTLHATKVPNEGPWDDRDLSDHGLICASLIHAVAPQAQVHLYETCGPDGHGRLFPLVEAVSDFITLAAGRPAVLSLSLGSLCATGSAALRAVLQRATDLGMVVCAAAGNAAFGTPKVSALLPAQVPASFPNVIAVSASNLASQRAGYSQRGDIAAPGGDAQGAPGPDDAEDIIGMGVSVGTSGYVRMDAGTSFSTPLVAGAVALLLPGHPSRDGETYVRVLDALKAHAAPAAQSVGECLTSSGLGAGILYLPGLV